MVSMRSALSLTAFTAVQYALLVQAEDLHDSPFVLHQGDGVIPLKDNAMIRGDRKKIQEIQYIVTDADGSKVMMQGNQVIGEVASPNEAYSDSEIADFTFFEKQFGKFIRNSDEIANKYKSGKLPRAPWPGSYWPVSDDGINFRWGDGPSASEKYAMAADIDVKKFMDNISSLSGVNARTENKACRKDSECQDNEEENKCAIRAGEHNGYCIQTWEGMCDGWAPAAVLENEPKCPVTIGDVIFQPKDIKALITQVYSSATIGTVYAGLSYTGNDDGVDDDKLDRYGRYKDPKHRDMSPAAFHILCANMIGKYQKPFIIDADAGVQIWNQPVYSYEFVEITPMEPNEVSKQFFDCPSYDILNKNAKKIQYVKNVFKYIGEGYEDGYLSGSATLDKFLTEVTYDYVLELDDKNNIIGGEWVNKSRYQDHPDFAWAVWKTPEKGFVAEGSNVSYDFVKMLNFLSNVDEC